MRGKPWPKPVASSSGFVPGTDGDQHAATVANERRQRIGASAIQTGSADDDGGHGTVEAACGNQPIRRDTATSMVRAPSSACKARCA